MFIEFKFENFLSFKEEATFSLVASALKDKKVDDSDVMYSPIANSKLRLLKSAAIFGANASGKSNFVQAFVFFMQFVINSTKGTQLEENIDVENFKLSTATENEPSIFEVVFLHKEHYYRYGFAVTPKKVEGEWLYIKDVKPRAKEVELFFRDADSFPAVHDRFSIGKDVVHKNMVRHNALLLSVAAQFNDPIANEVFQWLYQLNVISGLREEQNAKVTLEKLQDPAYKQRIIDFTKYADLGIDDIQFSDGEGVSGLDSSMNPTDFLRKQRTSTSINSMLSFHKKFDDNYQADVKPVEFSFSKSESHGTVKYFSLAGPILDTLDNGKTLIIDELDSKLHPLLTQKLISLFNSIETNPKNAQLIFTTQDTNLLSSLLFRRDQIWFTQKDRYGASTLYSLSEYAVRNDASYERDYLAGKYGAVPVFKNFKSLFGSNTASKNG